MEEQRKHFLDEAIQYNLLKQSQQQIRQAQWILFEVAAIGYATVGYFTTFYYVPIAFTIVGIVLSSLYVLLGFLSFRKPKVPIIIGMVFYGYAVMQISFWDPSTIFDGIIIKVIVLIGLVKGFFAAKDAEIQQIKLKIIREKLNQDN